MKDAVILAAGQASRAAPLSQFLPKPVFPIGPHVAIDYSIFQVRKAGLRPHVVISQKGGPVERHVAATHPGISCVEAKGSSPNLFDSLLTAADCIGSDSFLWLGAAVVFEDPEAVLKLASSHLNAQPFCTLFVQSHFRYKPKIVLDANENITRFVVGDDATPFSAPTAFAVSNRFFDYARSFSETEVFQQAIDDGRRFDILHLGGRSVEIHTIHDLWLASTMLFPSGYVDQHSRVDNCSMFRSFVYRSTLVDAEVTDSIVINLNETGSTIAQCLAYGNCDRTALTVALP